MGVSEPAVYVLVSDYFFMNYAVFQNCIQSTTICHDRKKKLSQNILVLIWKLEKE